MRYARLKLFALILRRFTPITRAARMKKFQDLMGIEPGMRILDLGGTPQIWAYVDVPLNLTILNLPGFAMPEQSGTERHNLIFVAGDATRTGFPDNSFDLVFSNSVIEHVGGAEKEYAFANEVRRLAPSYYVQTPSILFPVEAHTGLLGWWFYPKIIKRALYRRWSKILPDWGEMIAGTTVIRRATLRRYFSDAGIGVERFAGVPKSYYAYRVAAREENHDRRWKFSMKDDLLQAPAPQPQFDCRPASAL